MGEKTKPISTAPHNLRAVANPLIDDLDAVGRRWMAVTALSTGSSPSSFVVALHVGFVACSRSTAPPVGFVVGSRSSAPTVGFVAGARCSTPPVSSVAGVNGSRSTTSTIPPLIPGDSASTMK